VSKILIVDDDPEMKRALKLRLHSEGYETAFASDGVEATKQVKQGAPDVVLLDLGLPAGDGFVVLERLRSDPASCAIPVIVLTARDVESSRDKALKAGAWEFFQKPADNEDLMEAIAGAAAGKSSPLSR
jgi:CheY-like chemotaxis protein